MLLIGVVSLGDHVIIWLLPLGDHVIIWLLPLGVYVIIWLLPLLMAANMTCTTARNGRRHGYQGLHLPSTMENLLGRRRRQLLTIAQWNGRTLLDREVAELSEICTTALVAM